MYKKINIVAFHRSNHPNIKYQVSFIWKDKLRVVHFGLLCHEHFRDDTPLQAYSNMDNLDFDRRKIFIDHYSSIKKNGRHIHNNPLSPLYWDFRYLYAYKKK